MLVESSTAALMNQSIGMNPNTQSILVDDNGEYYFDDDFSVPFDANLREENNNMGLEEAGDTGDLPHRMVASKSDSCLYRAAQLSDEAEASDEDDMQEVEDIMGSEPLFPSEGNVQASVTCSMRLSTSSNWNTAIGQSLRKRLDQPIPHQDYKLIFGSPSHSQIDGNKDLNQSNTSGVSNGSANWSSVGTQGLPCTQSGLTTWGRIRSSKESMPSTGKKTHPVIADTSQASGADSPDNATTWKQMKKAASSKFVSWRELKNIVKNRDDGHSTKFNDDVNATVSTVGKFVNPSNLLTISLRSPHKTCTGVIKMPKLDQEEEVLLRDLPDRKIGETKHRFSGTLLELYRRAHALEASFTSDSSKQQLENTDITDNKENIPEQGQKHGQPWFNRLFANNSLSVSGDMPRIATDPDFSLKAVAHFGAQFPPPQARSHSACSRMQSESSTIRTSDSKKTRSTSLGVVRPGQRIAYPGLGILTIPKPSRLENNAFLSRTLPDLSFLAKSVNKSSSKRSSKSHRRSVTSSATTPNQTSGDSGFESTNDTASSAGQRSNSSSHKANCTSSSPRKRHSFTSIPVCRKCGCNVDSEESVTPTSTEGQSTPVLQNEDNATCPNSPLIKHRSVPNLNTSCKEVADIEVACDYGHGPPLKSCLVRNRNSLDRSCSDPNVIDQSEDHLNSTSNQVSELETLEYGNGHRGSFDSSQDDYGEQEFRAKKSVSFSEKILFHTPSLAGEHSPSGIPLRGKNNKPRPLSLVSDLRVIPRDCGLYGQDPPLAEFQLMSPLPHGMQKEARKSEMDLRYQALVNDVIKSVQQAVAYFSARGDVTGMSANQQSMLALSSSQGSDDSTSGNSTSNLLGLVAPLTTLVSDGLLPPSKAIFGSKPRPKLWLMVEESCRPGTSNRVLGEVFNEVKAIPSLTTEKSKFKAFICACLNAKSLPLWLSSVVRNDSLLKRYYLEDAFLRRCRSTQQELYADLTTSLELLLCLPFRLNLTGESRKKTPVRARHDIRAMVNTRDLPLTTGPPPPVPSHRPKSSAAMAAAKSGGNVVAAPKFSSGLPTQNNQAAGGGKLRSAFSSVRQKTEGYIRRNSTSNSTSSSVSGSTSSPTAAGPATSKLPNPVKSGSPSSSISSTSSQGKQGSVPSKIPHHRASTGSNNSTLTRPQHSSSRVSHNARK